MSWKVLVTARAFTDMPAVGPDLLREAGCELIYTPRPGPLRAQELLDRLPGIDAVLASLDHFTADVLSSSAAANLKLISRWGVGYDSIDTQAATRAGVVVAYTPGFLDETVADFSLALLLGVARRIHEGHISMRAGEWRQIWASDVFGKTLGIIGCGRIGQAVARRASGFGMRLLGFDINPRTDARALGIEFTSLDELLAKSDFVSLHSALTPENRGLLGEAQFRRMKPQAFFINTARGALVDENALIKALQEHWIAGAAVDAFAVEPLPGDHPLRQCPNLLLSPHQASFTRDTAERVSMAAAQAIADLAQGRAPRYLVNPEVLKSTQLKTTLRHS